MTEIVWVHSLQKGAGPASQHWARLWDHCRPRHTRREKRKRRAKTESDLCPLVMATCAQVWEPKCLGAAQEPNITTGNRQKMSFECSHLYRDTQYAPNHHPDGVIVPCARKFWVPKPIKCHKRWGSDGWEGPPLPQAQRFHPRETTSPAPPPQKKNQKVMNGMHET